MIEFLKDLFGINRYRIEYTITFIFDPNFKRTYYFDGSVFSNNGLSKHEAKRLVNFSKNRNYFKHGEATISYEIVRDN